jgi:glycosyltransferase involved in cell wall biosynthesis
MHSSVGSGSPGLIDGAENDGNGSARKNSNHNDGRSLLKQTRQQPRARKASWSRKVERFDAVVTLDFSAARTFQTLHDEVTLRVLDFIDSHPRYQNRYLRELCGLRDPHRELVFPESIGRIENEVELADLVLVPSRFVARQLEAVGVPAERVVIEPFGVDASHFHPPEAEAPRRDGLRCLFVGQISHRKGVGILREAARLLRDCPGRVSARGSDDQPGGCRGNA